MTGVPDLTAFRDGLSGAGLTPVGAVFSRTTTAGTWYGLPCEEGLLVAFHRGTRLYIELLSFSTAINIEGLSRHIGTTLTLAWQRLIDEMTI